MARIWAAPIIHCVALVSGTCSDTTSARARRSARRRAGLGAAERQLRGRVVEHDVHAQRLGHHAELRADIAVADDPQRLAAHFPAVGGGLDPLARCAATDFGKMPRISMMIWPSTSSATLRVLENGALKTGIARCRASSSATWSVPMQKQPRAISRSAAASTRGVTLVRERMPEQMDALDAGDQLVLVQRARQHGDAGVAVGRQVGDRVLVDALEQQDAHLLLGEGQSGQATDAPQRNGWNRACRSSSPKAARLADAGPGRPRPARACAPAAPASAPRSCPRRSACRRTPACPGRCGARGRWPASSTAGFHHGS